MSGNGMTELDAALHNRLTLPNGKTIEVDSMKTGKALEYMRAFGKLQEGSIIGLADLIENIGKDLAIEEELADLEIGQAVEFVKDFFALLMRRATTIGKKTADSSPRTPPSPSSSPSTEPTSH